MAFLNWKTVTYMFTVIFVNIWIYVDGFLVVKPQDTQVLAGQVATLNCSTSLTEDVHWYYGTSYIYAGRKLYSPFKDRLQIEVYQNDGATAYNLVFSLANPEDAGMYNCRDNQGSGETSSAEITVLTTDENGTCQSNMKPDGVVVPNDCNIDADEVQLSCSVTYYGKIPPQLEWKKVPASSNSVAKTDCQTIGNRIVCNTSIIADRRINRSSYVCQTTGSSKLNIISLCTIEGKYLIYAFNGQTAVISSVGNEVQCNPDTSQSCNYKWKHSGIVVSTSRTMTPDGIGLYQCEAECNIRGKRCVVFNYAYIGNDDSKSSSTGYFVGFVLLILLLVTAISTAIYFFLLSRGKGRLQQLRNMPRTTSQIEKDRDMMAMEDESQKERTPLIQPHDEMEAILDEPKLIRTVIPRAASIGKKAVFGLTILGEELFVLCYEWLEIEVFADLEILESIREVALIGHQLEFPWDIQSSYKHNCLYIVDKKKNENQRTEIIKIDPKGFVLATWKTECKAGRLSVTNEANVIITSLYDRRIREYSSDGKLIRFIDLPSEIVSPAWVTMKRSTDEYIISYGNKADSQHGVCVSDQNGNIKYNFIMKKGKGDGQPCVPVHMAAFSDGHVLVVDKDNHRVVMLSPYLKSPKARFSRGDHLRFPNRLCLDERNKQLFVSDNKWISDMKPWNDGRVLVFDMSSVQTSFNVAAEFGHELMQNPQTYGTA